MSGLKIEVQKDGGITLLKLKGEFEGMAALESRDAFFKHLTESKNLALDFGEIEYIDSASVGLLIDLAKEAAAKHIRFGLMNVNGSIKKVLVLTQVDKLITIY